METKENQRVALTKRLLQEGLLRLLDKKELSKISVTELCRESGINRATFYKHYGCPDDVLATIKEQFFQGLLDAQEQTPDNSPMTYIEAFGKVCVYFYENKALAIHIIKNLNFDISDIIDKTAQGQSGMYQYLERNFDADVIGLASTFIGYGTYSIIRQWLTEDIDKTPKEMELLVQRLLNSDMFQ